MDNNKNGTQVKVMKLDIRDRLKDCCGITTKYFQICALELLS